MRFAVRHAHAVPTACECAEPRGQLHHVRRRGPAAPATQFSACSGFDFTVALQTHLPNCFAQPPGVACAAAPVATCRGAGRSRLTIRNAPDRTRDALGWRWGKGDATIAGDFGDPGDTTGYRLCVYDEVGGVPALAVDATVPAGARWTRGKKGGWTYKSAGGAPSGVRQLVLSLGPDGKAKVVLVGKGGLLPLQPPATTDALLAADPAVRVQLLSSNGGCWESAFTAADVKLNTIHQCAAGSAR